MLAISAILIVLGPLCFCKNIEDPVIIPTTDGLIAGRFVITNYSEFYAFQEIPYAKPPVGSLRFKEPQPPEKWEGVLNTTTNTKICVQFEDSSDPRQNEDCLYLNVYTPKDPRNRSSRNLLPVIVWVHGGSFLSGSGSYDSWGPHFFMEKDIILVSINYRLGPFGFLTTMDDVIPGNNGLKDQHLAFKWVKDNILNFGGDPEKITLMGQSAGASSVSYHLLSDKSNGLFRAAIMHSSTSLTCFSLNKYAKEAAFMFGESLDENFNASRASSEDLLDLLRNVSVDDIQRNSQINVPLDHRNCYKYYVLTWTPVEENENNSNVIFTGKSHERLKNGDFLQLPILIGFNSQEVLLFNLTLISYFSEDVTSNNSYAVNENINITPENKEIAGQKIVDIYTSNGTFENNFPGAVKLSSDSIFTTPISRHGYLQSTYTDVFFYEFSYDGEMGRRFSNQTVRGAEGIGHQVELQYLFENESNENLNEFPEADLITQQRLLTLWVSFATHLNPTFEQLEITQNISWPVVQQDEFTYLEIGNNLTLRVDPKEYKRWSEIYQDYAEPILDTY